MQVAYFVYDLTDPAVGKRVRMLKAGGADVVVLGFRREDKAPAEIEGSKTVDLGRTYDARLGHRCLMVIARLLNTRMWSRELKTCDVLLARNLEMLALARAARRHCESHAGVAYECLDIHRLLLSRSLPGKVLRAVERVLMRGARLLIVSSPAFVTEYFERRQKLNRTWRIPILLVENKVLDLRIPDAANPSTILAEAVPGPPWRIGWFGMIRCHKSLDILCNLAKARSDLVQVTIRGRPSLVEFEDFHGQIDATPGVEFGGLYAPGEIGNLYRGIHFNWAIDFFEAGGNSELLLPNRIYEGGRHGAVPLALDGTEIARWLQRLGFGVVLESAGKQLEEFLERLTAPRYADLKRAAANVPPAAFIADRRDCARLVDTLAMTASRGRLNPLTNQAASSGA